MDNNEERLQEIKKNNDENIRKAVHMAKIAFGDKTEKIEKILHDPERLAELTSKLGKKEMDKLEAMLKNPDNIARLLQNDTVKQNIEKFLDQD